MCENELDMKKELTVLESFILTCETEFTYRILIGKMKKEKYLLSRLFSVPPSAKYLDDIIQELELRRNEQDIRVNNMIKKFIANSIYSAVEFENIFYRLGSKDIYNGYIPLYVSEPFIKEGFPSEYVCFFRPFNNGIVKIEVGDIIPEPKASELIELIEKSSIWDKNTKKDLRNKHINTLYAELLKQNKKR